MISHFCLSVCNFDTSVQRLQTTIEFNATSNTVLSFEYLYYYIFLYFVFESFIYLSI